MNPISPTSVTLCITSNTFLPLSAILSPTDSGAALAAWCAALSLCTLCSSVSPPGAPFPAAPEALDLGCGVVDVKRVASVALRGVERDDMPRIAPRAGAERSRKAGMCGGVSEVQRRGGVGGYRGCPYSRSVIPLPRGS